MDLTKQILLIKSIREQCLIICHGILATRCLQRSQWVQVDALVDLSIKSHLEVLLRGGLEVFEKLLTSEIVLRLQNPIWLVVIRSAS